MHVRGALGFMDQRRKRIAAHVAEQAAFAAAESKLPLPPTREELLAPSSGKPVAS
jgi:hypothetical protein